MQRGRGEDELKVGDKCAKGACKGCAMGVPRPLYALACNRQACKGGGKRVSVQEGKGRTREQGICAVGLQLPCTFRLGGWVCKKKWVCESGCVRVSVHGRMGLTWGWGRLQLRVSLLARWGECEDPPAECARGRVCKGRCAWKAGVSGRACKCERKREKGAGVEVGARSPLHTAEGCAWVECARRVSVQERCAKMGV